MTEATAGIRILGFFSRTNQGEARVATRTVEDCDKEGKGEAAHLEALRRMPRARPADRFGAHQGGLQDRRRETPQMHRNALVRRRREPRAVGALRPTRRMVRRLLGRPSATGGVRGSSAFTKICRTPQRVTAATFATPPRFAAEPPLPPVALPRARSPYPRRPPTASVAPLGALLPPRLRQCRWRVAPCRPTP